VTPEDIGADPGHAGGKIDARGLVIAINEIDQILDIASADVIVSHVTSHFGGVGPTPVPTDPIGRDLTLDEHRIDFFDGAGEVLALVVSDAWKKFEFVPSDEQIPIAELRGRIETVLRRRFEAIAEDPRSPVLTFPTDKDWGVFLAACGRLVAGTGVFVWPTDDKDPNDRRGWFHNVFVHGGNP
jgi:hypothetical protein